MNYTRPDRQIACRWEVVMRVRRTVGLVAAAMLCSALPNLVGAQQRLDRSLVASLAPDAQKDQAVNSDALVLQDFKTRIDGYMEIHNKVAKETPMKETDNPEVILVAQTAFGERLRQARVDAKAGDIFTPAIQERFRALLVPTLKGEDGRDAKKVLKDDAPPSVPLKVNAKYPKGAALPTVPISLLKNLPKLPEALEYRIINKHLILRDTKGDIIVDFIPNAIR